MGLDAPELPGECPRDVRQARAAKERMAVLVVGRVRLEPHGRDRCRRLLAVVRDRQGRDVAVMLIREGSARPYDGLGRWAGSCG